MQAFLKPVYAITFALTWQGAAMAEPIGRVTGIGGVFVKSKDSKALANWYRDVLGLDVADWGGAALPYNAPGHPPKISWMAFPETSDHMAPSTREFMVNFAVDDMDAIIARLRASHVAILKRDDDNAFGRFAWVQDPDGTLVELWQPK
ncbi:VOC family protein [Caulobacter zeae]|nr:VOC family protein [Caulobacter zeae]